MKRPAPHKARAPLILLNIKTETQPNMERFTPAAGIIRGLIRSTLTESPMKAEERHELRENDLASWLQYGLWAFLKQNGSYVLLVLALGFLGFQLWNMYERKQADAVRAAWLNLQDASSKDDPIAALSEVIDTSTVLAVKAEGSLELANIYEQLIAKPEPHGQTPRNPR